MAVVAYKKEKAFGVEYFYMVHRKRAWLYGELLWNQPMCFLDIESNKSY